jgi:hypothetical protein
MRTTLDLDDDILAAARELARQQGKTLGAAISGLVRDALTTPSAAEGIEEAFLGFRPFPTRGIVTNEAIDRLRDEGEY